MSSSTQSETSASRAPLDWQAELVSDLGQAGASAVGFADLSMLPEQARSGLPRGIAILVALDPSIIAGLTLGPTPAYYAEYQRANALLACLAEKAATAIHSHGFVAQPSAVTVRVVDGDGARALPHKTVATCAGLGWVGHSAVLVTRVFGKAVRLTSVLTDAPLKCGEPIRESRCGRCRACVDACPGVAIKGQAWRAGLPREEIYDAAACKVTASALAARQGISETICGICILACPWTLINDAGAEQLLNLPQLGLTLPAGGGAGVPQPRGRGAAPIGAATRLHLRSGTGSALVRSIQ